MASFAPASGAWPVDHDEFGNAVWRNQDARQVHHMYNMPGQLPPPLPALSPRVPFGPETHNPHFPGQLTLPPPALSPRGAFMPEAHYPHLPPGPDFTSSTRPLAEFPPLEHGPTEWITSPSFPLNNSTGIAATPQTPPPTLLSSKKEEEAKHWTQECNANGKKYYLNTLTMEWQLETPDCLKKYTTK